MTSVFAPLIYNAGEVPFSQETRELKTKRKQRPRYRSDAPAPPGSPSASASAAAVLCIHPAVMGGDSDVAPDWSDVPSDLLVSVLSLLQLPDLFASAAVCRAWRAACAAVRRLGLVSPVQAPYLVYSSGDRDSNTATLRNISTGKVYHAALPDPPFRSRYVVGSSRGWLVTADEQCNLHLLNPVTGAQVALPPPETIKGVTPSFTGDGVLSGYCFVDPAADPARMVDGGAHRPDFRRSKKARQYLYEKAILSSDPSSGDCIVLLVHQPWEHLSFARVGDTTWTWLGAMENCRFYHDIFYNDDDGLFYAIRGFGEIHTIDLNGPSPVVKTIFRLQS
ncbi:hypothetical protein ACP70R_037350 [Stipagrostis hirtigluma subsp. patula]